MSHAFSVRLQSLRSERGLSRIALAKQLGVSTPTLWGWEKGRSKPRPENMKALAQLLDVSEAFLTRGWKRGAGAVPAGEGLCSYVQLVKHEIATRAGVEPGHVTISIQY